jgi:hypothetical protein
MHDFSMTDLAGCPKEQGDYGTARGDSNFVSFPTLYAGKNPLLVDGRDPSLYHAKNAVGGSKNIPLTAAEIVRRM